MTKISGKVDMARGADVTFLATVLLTAGSMAVAADDSASLFKANCRACHTIAASEPQRQGPLLAGIVGRMAGKIEGFPYSKGLRAADWVWTPELIDKWITHPQAMVADSYMMSRQPDAAARANIIAYMQTLKP